MQTTLIGVIVIVFALSILIVFACNALRIPSIVGLLFTGVIAGPHGMRLISNVHDVEMMAEIGVILLLFTIGIEFSLKNLLQTWKFVLIGGALQVGLTTAVVAVIAHAPWGSWGMAAFAGFLVALSSTAIVLKILQERGEIDSPHGRLALGILIFQDIAIVPLILVTPFLAMRQGASGESLLMLMIMALLLIAIVILGARWGVPWFLRAIAATRSRELFILSTLGVCLAIAWLTSSMGLSLALGAFLAGLIVSETEYSHQAFASIIPFRDIFVSLFFISIGMLLDPMSIIQQPLLVLLLFAGVMLLKAVTGSLSVSLMGYPLRTAVQTGLSVSQIGEFSFILAGVGIVYGLLPNENYQLFLAVSILTMIVTPFIISSAPRLAEAASRLPLPQRIRFGIYGGLVETDKDEKLDNHLIIVGYGFNGANVAGAARLAGISYIVVEMNPQTVYKLKNEGERIFFGDAGNEAVLLHAGVEQARMMVIVISDAAATRRAVALARGLNPALHILVRTRFINEMQPLYALGANEVIPEEFETSVEICARVLANHFVPHDVINGFITKMRSDGYRMFRSFSLVDGGISGILDDAPNVEVSTVNVCPASFGAGKSPLELQLRNKYGVSLIAIRRGGETLPNPEAEMVIRPGDQVMLLGTPVKVREALKLFCSRTN